MSGAGANSKNHVSGPTPYRANAARGPLIGPRGRFYGLRFRGSLQPGGGTGEQMCFRPTAADWRNAWGVRLGGPRHPGDRGAGGMAPAGLQKTTSARGWPGCLEKPGVGGGDSGGTLRDPGEAGSLPEWGRSGLGQAVVLENRPSNSRRDGGLADRLPKKTVRLWAIHGGGFRKG